MALLVPTAALVLRPETAGPKGGRCKQRLPRSFVERSYGGGEIHCLTMRISGCFLPWTDRVLHLKEVCRAIPSKTRLIVQPLDARHLTSPLITR